MSGGLPFDPALAFAPPFGESWRKLASIDVVTERVMIIARIAVLAVLAVLAV